MIRIENEINWDTENTSKTTKSHNRPIGRSKVRILNVDALHTVLA